MIETLAKYFTEMFTMHPYLSILLLSIVLVSKYSWPYLFKKEQNQYEIDKIKIDQNKKSKQNGLKLNMPFELKSNVLCIIFYHDLYNIFIHFIIITFL